MRGYPLTDEDRRFILDFSIMIGATSDAIESLRFAVGFKVVVCFPRKKALYQLSAHSRVC